MVPRTNIAAEETVGPSLGRVARSRVTIIQKSLGNPSDKPIARPAAEAAPTAAARRNSSDRVEGSRK